jgi:hypothetical protein
LIDAGLDWNDDGDISHEEAASCSELYLDDCDLDDLQGLEYFYYLEILDLSDNYIDDLSGLVDKPILEDLNLNYNYISNISVLGGLTELTIVELYDNSITDVSALEKLLRLSYLNLRKNLITDISSLADLPELSYITLKMNRLDISEGSATMAIIDAWDDDGVEVYYDPQQLDFDVDYDVGSPEITDISDEGFTLTVGGGTGTTNAIESGLGDLEYYAGYYVVEHDDEDGYLTDEDAFDCVWYDGEWDDLWYNEDTDRYEYTFTINGLDPETEYDVYTLIEVYDDDTRYSYVSIIKRVSTTTAEVEAELSPTPTDEAELSPSPTVEAELSPTPTDEAEATLIEADEGAGSVEGEDGTTFEPGTEFVIEKVTAEVSDSDMEDYTAGVKLLIEGMDINEIYEIRLLLDGEPVQPDGSVTVRIKLTAEQKALGGLKIVYIDDLGVVTLIESTVEGDYIIFTTDHFSTYGLLADSVSPNPETGDSGATGTILFVLAAVAVLMLARRRSVGKAV